MFLLILASTVVACGSTATTVTGDVLAARNYEVIVDEPGVAITVETEDGSIHHIALDASHGTADSVGTGQTVRVTYNPNDPVLQTIEYSIITDKDGYRFEETLRTEWYRFVRYDVINFNIEYIGTID